MTNFESDKSPAEFANLYKQDGLTGGHVIMLGADPMSKSAAIEDLHAYPGTFAKIPFAGIPEALRPKPGRLSNTQQRVYEDFVRFPWQNQSTQSSNAVTAGLPGSSGGSASSGLSRVYGSSSGKPNSSIYSTAQMIPGIFHFQVIDV